MISILVPSRERAKLLKVSIESLGEGDFEVLVWIDDDDPQLEAYLELPATIFIRSRVGYPRFNEMVNYLASKARGDWLLLWNDDMRIDSKGWIDKIYEYNSNVPAVLNFWNPTNMRDNLAPVVSYSMYKIMGHFSLSTHCDSWVQDIANELSIHMPVFGVSVSHLREVLNDSTKQHSQTAYGTTSPAYDNEPYVTYRIQDARKIGRRL